MAQEITFSEVILALQDEAHTFPAQFLHRLSDLTPKDLRSILDVWPELSQPRKRSLLEELEAISDADTLVSFDDLAIAIIHDPDPGVRVRAISLLWECSDRKLVPIFITILNEDEDDDVRAAAASILGQFVYRGEVDEIPEDLLHETEAVLLDHTGADAPSLVRRRSLEALGASSRKDVPQLIDTAYHRKEPEWIVSALHAMGRSSDERWEKYVIARLHDQDEEIRSEAVRSAGKLGLSSARSPLLDLLADEEESDSRREIIWSLSEIGGDGVKAKLEELMETEEDDEQLDFLEEALENLLFTEDLNNFSLLDLDDPDQDFSDDSASSSGIP